MTLSDDAYAPYADLCEPGREPLPMLARTRQRWRQLGGAQPDLWVFGYASLVWRPDFDFAERHATRVHGWHRALAMWSRVNRGTPERPGLVFALLPGGSCTGLVFRVPGAQAEAVFDRLWAREMPSAVYDPRWLPCATPHGVVHALAFTLSRRSPSYAGELAPAQYRDIFRHARGRYGSTLDYARLTHDGLRAHGVHDRRLAALLRHAGEE
ncbi:MAG: gamma-glutamylcyclotransferase [Pseudomonadota bacterium]|nr:gamma-glutamylcyclotransferase [Pseudomonadota bacterium]